MYRISARGILLLTALCVLWPAGASAQGAKVKNRQAQTEGEREARTRREQPSSSDLASQNTSAPSSAASSLGEEDHDGDNPRRREAWFNSGRVVRGESSATLRVRALRARNRMRTPLQKAAARGALSQALPASGLDAQWRALGPAPIHSDTTLGQYYGYVSGRVTAVAIDPDPAKSGNTIYIGGAYGGVWRSNNAGALSGNGDDVVWEPILEQHNVKRSIEVPLNIVADTSATGRQEYPVRWKWSGRLLQFEWD